MIKELILDTATGLYPAESFARFEIPNNSVKLMQRESFVKGAVFSLENQWIDLYDHLPEQLKSVLVFNGYLTQIGFLDDKIFYNTDEQEISDPRYWMHIPETPKNDNTPIINLL